ncbi:MAG: alpha/beta hydrolase [Gammaproteobacteria bacterium]|jgi:fermentation-respiration switch protein FrsA (DUF1100 family)
MIGLLAALLLVVGIFSGFMYINQPDMVFFPIREMRTAPSAWGVPYEDVWLTTADSVDLHGWYIPAKQNGTKTVLFFHGNAGNISHRGESVLLFHELGANVLIFDYRGYGKSYGEPSEAGLYDDARAAWRYLTEDRKIAAQDIVLFGRSLGAVAAIKLATEVQPAGVIAESPFSSARDMARQMFPWLSYIIVVRFDFNNVENIRQVTRPVLILHSPEDNIIPYNLGRRVFEAANEPKTFFQMKGDHNSGFIESQPEYGQQLETFIANPEVSSSG